MVPLFLLLGFNLSYIVDLFAALHELASASARTLLKLTSLVCALVGIEPRLCIKDIQSLYLTSVILNVILQVQIEKVLFYPYDSCTIIIIIVIVIVIVIFIVNDNIGLEI